jgi:hypothetical protein
VIEAGDEAEVLAKNEVGEPVFATPAIADDTLCIRSEQRLFAFSR